MAATNAHPEVIGSYRIEGVLGGGGMGVVYRGVDSEGRAAAIKVIRASFTSVSALRRFEREASIQIEHDNIVRVLETGSDAEGMPFIAFELLEGETLDALLAQGTMEIDAIVDLGVAICRGLAAAHREGIVHRDLKPSNIFLVAGGGVKLLDFGVARLRNHETKLTDAGLVVGTLSYLSPEQAEGRPDVGPASDLFSLGAVLYEALVGRPPFHHDTPLSTLVATLLSDPSPPHLERPETPVALEAVLMRALQKNPRDRFSDATELGDALADARGDAAHEVRARPPTIRPGETRVVAVLLARGVRDEARISTAIREEGGRVLRVLGDRLVGLFGAETTAGDELLRAASVAVRCRLHADRIAIGSGRASSDATGISGSALEEAESACAIDIAGVGVSAEAARGLPSAVPLEALDDTRFQLGPDTRVLAAIDEFRDEGPMFARDVELALIERALDDAITEDRATVALITGPQGIGKSRLREAALSGVADSARPIRVLRARGTAQRSRRALSLFQSLIREALAELRADGDGGDTTLEALVQRCVTTPDTRERIVSDLSLLVRDASSDEERYSVAATDLRRIDDRLRVSLLEWLEATCRAGPVVLVLEDLSFADPQSLEVLDRLAERCFDAPLLVLGCARPSLLEAHPDLFAGAEVHLVKLRGLNRVDVGNLAAHVTKRDVPEALTARIHERTAGNPFFVQQIAAALAERGELDDPPDELPIPLTVEAAVQSRLDQLPAAEKDLVKRAAIFRRPFSPEDISALGTAEPGLLLRMLRRREVVVSRGRGLFDFKSSLTAGVAYRMISVELRASLHRDAARWLEGRPGIEPEEVGQQYEDAGDGEIAARWYARAVELATRRGDADTVLRASESALRLGAPSELLFALRIARVDALRFRSRQEQATELEAALACARDDRDRARVLAEKCVALSRLGRSADATRVGEEALDAARRAGVTRLIAIAEGRLALALIQAGDLDRASELVAEAEVATEEETPELRAMVLEWRAQVAGAAGDLGTRMRSFAAAADLHELVGDARRAAGVRGNLADIHNRLGAYAEAVSALSAALEACREVGHRAMEGYVLLNLGYSLAMLGDVAASAASLDAAQLVAEGTDEARLILLVEAYRARTLHLAGRHEDALRVARRAAEGAREAGMETVAVGAEVIAAGAALALGRVAESVETASAAHARCLALGGIEEDESDVYVTYARALRAAGRADEARAILAEGRARLDQLASSFRDVELARALRENVPAHRELAALAKA